MLVNEIQLPEKKSEATPATNTPHTHSSRLKGFYKLSRPERLETLTEQCNLNEKDLLILLKESALSFAISDTLVENALGSFSLPLGVMSSLKMNNKDFIVPMAVEESSVIAAASNAARIVYECGGFSAETLSSLMIGQVQVLDLNIHDFPRVVQTLEREKNNLIQKANTIHPRLVERGGGVKDLEIRCFPDAEIPFLVVHFYIDCKEAMGANLINTVCEKMAPEISELCGGRVGLRILSNLCDRRIYKASCSIDSKLLGIHTQEFEYDGDAIAQRMYEAFVFADNDPYRAATHNKGIMNGVDPVVIATGNDWRAVSAGVHAYAAASGKYRSLSKWTYNKQTKKLCGELTLPLQIGTVGGVTKLNPTASVALKILGNPSTETLSQVMVCAGLASNLAALRALVSMGIQSGHMRLHAKNIALSAGAEGAEIETVSQLMIQNNSIHAISAETYLDALRNPL